MSDPLRIVSFGAGVQSTALLHLVLRGKLPRPNYFIFADTGCEPPEVYDHLGHCSRLMREAGLRLLYVQSGELMPDVLKGVAPDGASRDSKAGHYTNLPAFIQNEDGTVGIGSRHCTKDYKIRPIRQMIRNLLDVPKPRVGAVEQWFGISVDEADRRMRTSDVQYIEHRYPLVYDVGWTRAKCMSWLDEIGAGVPERSACIICPYRSNHEWRRMKRDQKTWSQIVKFDASIRRRADLRGPQFLHRECVPIDEVDLSTEEERGQGNLFGGECEGYCGN